MRLPFEGGYYSGCGFYSNKYDKLTYTLTNNTNINGVRTLVSELHIVADQASTVTCTSETTSSRMSQVFNVSGTVHVYYIHALYASIILMHI